MLLPDHVLEFFDKELKGCTVGDVLKDPERFKDRTLADPIEGVSYGRQTAKVMLGYFLGDYNGPPFINSFAHGGMRYTLAAGRPSLSPRPNRPRHARSIRCMTYSTSGSVTKTISTLVTSCVRSQPQSNCPAIRSG